MYHPVDRLHKQGGRRLITGSRCYLAVYYIYTISVEKVPEFMQMTMRD